MKQMLIVPDRRDVEGSVALARDYDAGFEYNDFTTPDVLDDKEKTGLAIRNYQKFDLPKVSTVHGAFYDVIPFSLDSKIREISDLRIRQSIAVAKQIKAKSVIFHTNYNPFLNSATYVKSWVEANAAYWSRTLEEKPEINIYLENTFEKTPDILVQLKTKT